MNRAPLLGLLLVVFAPCANVHAQEEPSFQGKKASEWVAMLQKDTSARRREGAVLALSQIGTTSPFVLPSLRLALREDPAVNVRLRIVRSFMLVKSEEAGPIISELAEALKVDKSPTVRVVAASALGQLGDVAKPALPALVEALKDTDTATRAACAESIGRLGADGRVAVPQLHILMKDNDASVRLYAVFALGRIGVEDPDAIREIANRLATDTNDVVRKEAARSLGMLGNAAMPSISSLIEALKGDKSISVRQEVVQALIRLAPIAGDATPVLLTAMRMDGDKSVRSFSVHAAVLILGENAKSAVPDLAAALDKEEIGDVKIAIIQELAALGSDAEAALPALKNAQKDIQIIVRDASAAAIKKISSKSP